MPEASFNFARFVKKSSVFTYCTDNEENLIWLLIIFLELRETAIGNLEVLVGLVYSIGILNYRCKIFKYLERKHYGVATMHTNRGRLVLLCSGYIQVSG